MTTCPTLVILYQREQQQKNTFICFLFFKMGLIICNSLVRPEERTSIFGALLKSGGGGGNDSFRGDLGTRSMDSDSAVVLPYHRPSARRGRWRIQSRPPRRPRGSGRRSASRDSSPRPDLHREGRRVSADPRERLPVPLWGLPTHQTYHLGSRFLLPPSPDVNPIKTN